MTRPVRAEATAAWVTGMSMVALVMVPVLAAGAIALSVVDRGLAVDAPALEPTDWFVAIQVSSAAIWLAGCLALRQRRDLLWSPLAGLVALSHAAAAFCFSLAVHGLIGGGTAPGAAVAAGALGWLLPIEMPVGIYMIVSLPTGRLDRTTLDRFGMLAVAMATGGVALAFVSVPDLAGTPFAAARNVTSLGVESGPFTALLIAPAAVLSVVLLVVKWRSSGGAERLALRWVVWVNVVGTVVVVPLVALTPDEIGVAVAQVASALGLLVLVTVIRRQHLLGVERLFERSLRFVLLAAALAFVYSIVIAVGTEVLGSTVRPLAAAVVALAVLPLRDAMDTLVRRFVYGHRANAAAIVHDVAEGAAGALRPIELTQRFVEELVSGIGAAGASVTVDDHGVICLVGESPVGPDIVSLPLRHRDEEIGRLTVSPPVGEQSLDAVAERVVAEVAPHIAIVADAARTDVELQQARTRLIASREEERRRLRHDLHDGLGPILTGAAFSADAASNLVDRDPDEAGRLITSVRHDVSAALDEIRRIVEELRPPALDELGLMGAISQHAQRLPQLVVETTGADAEGELPAAVEVAAYRIATEALTNVARHAGATCARVALVLNGDLALTITDDGPGHEAWTSGVGLQSMRERARELGGSLSAGPGPDGGVVTVRLPTVTALE